MGDSSLHYDYDVDFGSNECHVLCFLSDTAILSEKQDASTAKARLGKTAQLPHIIMWWPNGTYSFAGHDTTSRSIRLHFL